MAPCNTCSVCGQWQRRQGVADSLNEDTPLEVEEVPLDLLDTDNPFPSFHAVCWQRQPETSQNWVTCSIGKSCAAKRQDRVTGLFSGVHPALPLGDPVWKKHTQKGSHIATVLSPRHCLD